MKTKKHLTRLSTYILIFAFSFLLITCNSTEPSGDAVLSVEDASCTEAWLKLNAGSISLPANAALLQDGKNIQTLNITTADTILYVDSLLPNKTYTFEVTSDRITSNRQQVTTMDTTSHSFTWQMFEFGDHSSSYLSDVAIINENNIWAVGEIFMNDTLGNIDLIAYNAVHWDGNKWQAQKIEVAFRGNLITPPIYGIASFSETEIWMSSGVPVRGDGRNWIQYHLFDMGILNQDDGYLTKIWGNSSTDLYYVGTLGTIIHFNGQTWQKIESGTDLTIRDIWGGYNEVTKENEIICVASEFFENKGTKLIKIIGGTVEEISSNGLPWSAMSIWFMKSKQYYVAGDGIFAKHSLNETTWKNKPQDITTYYTYKARGNEINDVIVVGAYGEIVHFNGLDWKSYINTTHIEGNLYSVAIQGNIVVAVGSNNNRAVILVGRR